MLSGLVLVAQSPLDRVVGTFRADQTIQVNVPTQVPMGVEFFAENTKQPQPGDPLLVLTGRPFRDALDLLIRVTPGYVWRNDGDVVHVLLADNARSILARRVEDFSLGNVTALTALTPLCEVLQHRRKTGSLAGSFLNPTPLALRRFSVPTMTGTLEEVLDAIARQHGALVWHVSYPWAITYPVPSNFPVGIGLTVFDGWGTGIADCVPH